MSGPFQINLRFSLPIKYQMTTTTPQSPKKVRKKKKVRYTCECIDLATPILYQFIRLQKPLNRCEKNRGHFKLTYQDQQFN